MTTTSIAGGGTVRLGQAVNLPGVALAKAAIQSLFTAGGYTSDSVSAKPFTSSDATVFNVYNPSAVSGATYSLAGSNSQVLWEGGSNTGKPTTPLGTTLIGVSSGPELIVTDNSNDTVNAAGGSGTVITGSGKNLVEMNGPGNGGGSLDIVTGTGSDTVSMWGGAATISAYGKDTVSIVSGANTVTQQPTVPGTLANTPLRIDVSSGATATLYLSGNDTISYGSGADTAQILGTATVMASSSGLLITEGAGAETAKVGMVSATLIGGGSGSSLVGGSIANTFQAGGGSETMVGNKTAAANVFSFAESVGGAYSISNFANSPGHADTIQLVGYALGATAIQDALNSAQKVGSSTLIHLDNGSNITLVGYTKALTLTDFSN